MANRERGEVSLAIDGKSYTLVVDTNAMAAMEEAFSTPQHDVTFSEVLERVNAGSIRHIRGFVWGALQAYHPTMTIAEAGDLIQRAGGLVGFTQQLQTLMAATTPEADDVQALGIAGVGNNGNPPPAQARRKRGTGVKSTVTPAA